MIASIVNLAVEDDFDELISVVDGLFSSKADSWSVNDWYTERNCFALKIFSSMICPSVFDIYEIKVSEEKYINWI